MAGCRFMVVGGSPLPPNHFIHLEMGQNHVFLQKNMGNNFGVRTFFLVSRCLVRDILPSSFHILGPWNTGPGGIRQKLKNVLLMARKSVFPFFRKRVFGPFLGEWNHLEAAGDHLPPWTCKQPFSTYILGLFLGPCWWGGHLGPNI